jgi:hypothetical protein
MNKVDLELEEFMKSSKKGAINLNKISSNGLLMPRSGFTGIGS